MNHLKTTRGKYILQELVLPNEMFVFFDDFKYFRTSRVVFCEESLFLLTVFLMSYFSRIAPPYTLNFLKIFNYFTGGMIPTNKICLIIFYRVIKFFRFFLISKLLRSAQQTSLIWDDMSHSEDISVHQLVYCRQLCVTAHPVG